MPKIRLPWIIKFAIVYDQVIPSVASDSVTDMSPEDAEQAPKNLPILLSAKTLLIKYRIVWIDYNIMVTTRSLTLVDPSPPQDPATKGVARQNSGNSTQLFDSP